jgi:malate dehydrogenase (oxaloacetate-decarboxylating)
MVSRAPIRTLTDLRMIYTPGVADACKVIEAKPELAWDMTGICDRVAIVTNGTAVLGLGDIGVLASLPVMEGKAAIFAEFTGISAVPVLIESKDVQTIVETVVLTAGSYGAIQLEDIAAPECFDIEQQLRDRLDIPVFHDDQHGTATVVLAAMINALKKTGKKIENCKAIMLGAGAAGYAITVALLKFGIGDVVVYDSFGPIYRGRTEKMNKWKEELARITNKNNEKGSLLEGFNGKDIFIGVARPKMVSKEMIAAMNKNSIVMPLSNPVGEIDVQDAMAAGAAVAADGRTINNALAYPALFRGAMDVKAKDITFEMQLAAAKTLASLAADGDLLPDVLDRNVHKLTAKAVSEAWLAGDKA